jgi:hypothetical protein
MPAQCRVLCVFFDQSYCLRGCLPLSFAGSKRQQASFGLSVSMTLKAVLMINPTAASLWHGFASHLIIAVSRHRDGG